MNRLNRAAVALSLLLGSLSLSLAVSFSAHAGQRELNKLLENRKRPTIAQVLRAGGKTLERQNPFAREANLDPAHALRMGQLPQLARVIAFMEKAFPGAIWAPLGRDAVIFGDLLDAFYTSIGQPGRVFRLNASGASFAYDNDNRMRAALLRSAGFDVRWALKRRPLVGLDRTGYSPSSQSTRLIQAGYQAYAERGKDPSDLIHKLNFFGLSRSADPQILTSNTIERYFDSVGISTSTDSLSSIMQLPIGNWTDSTAWHDTFDTLKRYADGRVEGAPGPLSNVSYRAAVLGQLIDISRAASAPGFLAQVQSAARSMGYEFVAEKASYEQLLEKLEVSEAQRRAETFEEELNESYRLVWENMTLPESYFRGNPEEDRRMETTNAAKLVEWLRSAKSAYTELHKHAPEAMESKVNSAPIYLLQQIDDLRNRQLITWKDCKYLLAHAFSAAHLKNDDFLEFVSEQYKKRDSLLRQALQKESRFFLSVYRTQRRPGTARTRTVFRQIRSRVMQDSVDCEEIFGQG